MPKHHVREFVERLAKENGVEYERSGLDDFAEAATRLSGDNVKLDHPGKLMVALKKRKLLTGPELARLMTNYMLEKRSAP